MRIVKLEIENFRCFEHLLVDFCTNCTSEAPQGKGGMTVFVAANGQGKTAILEAVKYLLAIFISRFPKTSVPRIKESDYREEWIVWETLIGNPQIKIRTPPYMRLWTEAEFPCESDTTVYSSVPWEIIQKRDKSEQTNALFSSPIGTKRIYRQADVFIDHDNREDSIMLPVIAYYNTERAVIRNKPERRRGFQKAFNRYDAYAGALDNGLNYKKTIEWFCYLEDKQRREREAVRDWDYQTLEHRTIQLAIEKMLPGFKNLRTILAPLDLIVDIEENGTFKSCRIDTQLSDGYKIVLVLVLDIVSRILEANSVIPNITPEQLLQSGGIVLIDEVDLHLHPSWQQRILSDLQRTFPNIQFIVTTHSPQVVSSVPKECIRIINDGQIVPFSSPTQGVEVGDILAGIFGTDPIPQNSEIAQKLNRLHAMLAEGKGDFAEWESLYQELEKYYGKDYSPLLGAKAHRDFLKKMRAGGLNA